MVVIQVQEKLIMKSTVTGYYVKMTYILSRILVHIIIFIHNEEREAKTDSVSQMELIVKEQLTLFLSLTVAVFWAYLLVISISALVSPRVQRILQAMHEYIKNAHSVEGAELSLATVGFTV